jgi:broad specificity phosphatase PhoE
MKLLLVRHGRAGHRSEWDGDDRARPLSRRGRKQAEGVVTQLSGYRIDRVLSSPYVRCVQTVEPLAAAAGLEVEESDEFAEGNGYKGIEVVRGLAEGDANVVACSHGDVIPDIVEHLVRTDHMSLPDLQGWAKGSTWVLTAKDGRFDSAIYLPAPPT